MKIGVIELIEDTASKSWTDRIYRAFFKKYHASIIPQAVSVWCRQLGHQVWYATYYGQRDPVRLLPDELDVVFVASYTQASALAYALAKVYRMRKTLTVIGGPHAKAFPRDCLRFFDLAVKDCDKTLIDDILRGHFDRHTVITSGRALRELLEADLQYLARNWPGVMVTYHDPNFGVKFDQVLGIVEEIPKEKRSPYIIESSLSILRGAKLPRLRDTKCLFIAPGVESWNNYSNKAGVGATVGKAKLTQVVEHFREIRQYVPGLQANFLFGTDADQGEEPVELTKEFMRAVPFVWPTINIPTPFGNTPLYDRALANGQILQSMPFSFYYTPYLVTTMPHYPPLEYYDKLIDLYSTMTSNVMLKGRFGKESTLGFSVLNALRTFAMRQDLAALRLLRRMLATDPEFLAFHEGRTRSLPEFYHRRYEQKLGRYANLISRAERTPELEKPASSLASTAPGGEVADRLTAVIRSRAADGFPR